MKILVEPSSATVLAAVLKNKEKFKGKKVVLVITGGNVDIQLPVSKLWRKLEYKIIYNKIIIIIIFYIYINKD